MSKKILFLINLFLLNSFYFVVRASDQDLVSFLAIMQSRKYSNKSMKAFVGFVDLIEGAESLISENNNPLHDLQRLIEGVSGLISASTNGLTIDTSEQLRIAAIIEDFKLQIGDLLHTNNIVKNTTDSDVERQKLIDGLTIILYNSVYILIDPKSMQASLSNILSGVYKVISAILADGKISQNDLGKLLRALASIFSLSSLRQIKDDYSATAI